MPEAPMPGEDPQTTEERIDLVAPQTGVSAAVLGVLAVVAEIFLYSYVAARWEKLSSFADRDTALEFAVRRGAAWTVTILAILLAVAVVGFFVYAVITTLRNRGASLTLTGREAVLDLPDGHLVLSESEFCRILCGDDRDAEAVAAVRGAMRMRGDLRRKLADRCARSISLDKPLRFDMPHYLPAAQVGGVLLFLVLSLADHVSRFGLPQLHSWGALIGSSGEPRWVWLVVLSVIFTPLVIIGLIVWGVTVATNSAGAVEVDAKGLTIIRRDDRRSFPWDSIQQAKRGWLQTGALRLHTDEGVVKLPHPLESDMVLKEIVERRIGKR